MRENCKNQTKPEKKRENNETTRKSKHTDLKLKNNNIIKIIKAHR